MILRRSRRTKQINAKNTSNHSTNHPAFPFPANLFPPFSPRFYHYHFATLLCQLVYEGNQAFSAGWPSPQETRVSLGLTKRNNGAARYFAWNRINRCRRHNRSSMCYLLYASPFSSLSSRGRGKGAHNGDPIDTPSIPVEHVRFTFPCSCIVYVPL